MSNLPTLGGSSATDSGSASPASTGSQSVSDSNSAPSPTDSASASDSAAGSNTITNAPSLGTASSDSASNTITDAPSLTSDDFFTGGLTGLPTLSGYYSYPPPSVPPTANAPYMQRTNLPENFVFIVVGACIAFVALFIIVWRILTSWSINRRFKRDAGHGATYTPLTDFKQKPTNASSNEMKDLSALPKSFSSVPSLFFSPTAEVARNSMIRPQSQHQHLPAGHYRDASDGGRR